MRCTCGLRVATLCVSVGVLGDDAGLPNQVQLATNVPSSEEGSAVGASYDAYLNPSKPQFNQPKTVFAIVVFLHGKGEVWEFNSK